MFGSLKMFFLSLTPSSTKKTELFQMLYTSFNEQKNIRRQFIHSSHTVVFINLNYVGHINGLFELLKKKGTSFPVKSN